MYSGGSQPPASPSYGARGPLGLGAKALLNKGVREGLPREAILGLRLEKESIFQ